MLRNTLGPDWRMLCQFLFDLFLARDEKHNKQQEQTQNWNATLNQHYTKTPFAGGTMFFVHNLKAKTGDTTKTKTQTDNENKNNQNKNSQNNNKNIITKTHKTTKTKEKQALKEILFSDKYT